MGIRERRERSRQEIRDRILDVARDLFAREGYEAVTMRRIADAIEYSPTTIYLHFKDKETLVRQLCTADFLSLAETFRRIAKEADPLEKLRKLALAYVDFAMSHPNHYRLMFMTPPLMEGSEEGRRVVEPPKRHAYDFLTAAVAEAVAAGRLRRDLNDVELVSQTLWAVVHGVVSLHIAMAADDWVNWRPAKKTAALVIDLMLCGLAPDAR